ncbi:hemagglutinin repeat-containing protein [Desulfovibrio cuneatus]|uniref:hemagglutinin repeat-containing protein n=1 Tax=Desulfovibrio cuneatus TaxID=159728 RepID=UPI000A042729|nr:hemagglutinin repeat-containing protein [Desulfovibrio cuneatus]
MYTSSGRDTTVAGAHLEGDRVWMDVGRDLTVASLQDQYDSKNYSWSAGADVTVIHARALD